MYKFLRTTIALVLFSSGCLWMVDACKAMDPDWREAPYRAGQAPVATKKDGTALYAPPTARERREEAREDEARLARAQAMDERHAQPNGGRPSLRLDRK